MSTSANTTAQSARILAYLRAGYSLNPLDALNRFGCFRLGARVWDLRREGHAIESKMVERNGKRFSEYWISGTDIPLFPDYERGESMSLGMD